MSSNIPDGLLPPGGLPAGIRVKYWGKTQPFASQPAPQARAKPFGMKNTPFNPMTGKFLAFGDDPAAEVSTGGGGGGLTQAQIEAIVNEFLNEHLPGMIDDYLDEHLDDLIDDRVDETLPDKVEDIIEETLPGAIDDIIENQQELLALLLVDIKERQQARGIVSPWLIDSTGATSYSFAQLQGFVNDMCDGLDGSFIENGYVGFDSPPYLASTYADSAMNIAELRALVLAMLKTKRTYAGGSVGFSDISAWYGQTVNSATRAAAITASVSNISVTASASLPLACRAAVGYIESYDYWRANFAGMHWRHTISGLFTGLSASILWYAKADSTTSGILAPYYFSDPTYTQVYSSFGLPGVPPSANAYSNVATASVSGSAAATSGLCGAGAGLDDHSWTPPTWPSHGEYDGYETYNFLIDHATSFALIAWGFTHV